MFSLLKVIQTILLLIFKNSLRNPHIMTSVTFSISSPITNVYNSKEKDLFATALSGTVTDTHTSTENEQIDNYCNVKYLYGI